MQQPTDTSRYGKERFTELFLEWQRRGSRRSAVPYDEWMNARFHRLAKRTVLLRQGAIVLELRHGQTYSVRGDDGKERMFRVQLSRDFPHISFRQPSGVDLPWIAFPGVFTQAELITLRRVS